MKPIFLIIGCVVGIPLILVILAIVCLHGISQHKNGWSDNLADVYLAGPYLASLQADGPVRFSYYESNVRQSHVLIMGHTTQQNLDKFCSDNGWKKIFWQSDQLIDNFFHKISHLNINDEYTINLTEDDCCYYKLIRSDDLLIDITITFSSAENKFLALFVKSD